MADINKIKSNIKIMISKNAPESDIDSYIESQGVTLDQLQNTNNVDIQPQTTSSFPTGVAPPIAGQVDANTQPNDVAQPPFLEQPFAEQPSKYPIQSSIFPVRLDAPGDYSFDSNAGLVGLAKNAVTLPGDAYYGEVNLNTPEGQKRVTDMASVLTPMGTASRVKGSVFAPKSAYKAPKSPTRQELSEATNKAYKEVAKLDIKYSPVAVEKMVTELERSLNEEGFIAAIKGVDDVFALISSLKGAPKDSYVKMSSLDVARQRLNDLAGSPKNQVKKAAQAAINKIDDFIASPNGSNLVGKKAPTKGQELTPTGFNFSEADAVANKAAAQQASKKILEARANAAAGFRSDKIQELREIMDLKSSASNSGMNIDNTVRQKLAALLTNSGGKGVRGFSKEEKEAIRSVVTGTPTKNALRYVGNLLGGGGGLGQGLTTFLPAGGVLAADGGIGAITAAMAPGVVGAVSKRGSNRIANNEIKAIEEQIRLRSPLGQRSNQVYAPSSTKETMIKTLAAPVNSQPNNTMQEELLRQFLARGGV